MSGTAEQLEFPHLVKFKSARQTAYEDVLAKFRECTLEAAKDCGPMTAFFIMCLDAKGKPVTSFMHSEECPVSTYLLPDMAKVAVLDRIVNE